MYYITLMSRKYKNDSDNSSADDETSDSDNLNTKSKKNLIFLIVVQKSQIYQKTQIHQRRKKIKLNP